MTQSTEKYTVFLTTENLMNRFTGRQTHTHRDIMDDKEKLDKIRQHIDDVENRKDVNVRLQFLLIEEIKKILEE